jgi:hypothetical protein
MLHVVKSPTLSTLFPPSVSIYTYIYNPSLFQLHLFAYQASHIHTPTLLLQFFYPNRLSSTGSFVFLFVFAQLRRLGVESNNPNNHFASHSRLDSWSILCVRSRCCSSIPAPFLSSPLSLSLDVYVCNYWWFHFDSFSSQFRIVRFGIMPTVDVCLSLSPFIHFLPVFLPLIHLFPDQFWFQCRVLMWRGTTTHFNLNANRDYGQRFS